jgi:hypothetical protein
MLHCPFWLDCECGIKTPLCVLQHILPRQRLLQDESTWEPVLALVRDEQVCERLRGKWQREQGRLTTADINVERWQELDAEISRVRPRQPFFKTSQLAV